MPPALLQPRWEDHFGSRNLWEQFSRLWGTLERLDALNICSACGKRGVSAGLLMSPVCRLQLWKSQVGNRTKSTSCKIGMGSEPGKTGGRSGNNSH